MKCPKCNSDNTQRQRMVFRSGTTYYDSTFLADKCRPPRKAGPTGLSALFFCGIILSFIIQSERMYYISLVSFFVRLLWVLFIKAPNDRKEYRRKKSIYERSWICHRCGHMWEEEMNPLDMF